MTVSGDLSRILRAQNPDGGWGYHGGPSWMEATALALLAQSAAAHVGTGFARGLAWLRRQQRPDGGWPPHPAVEESTWVTSLVLLAASDWLDEASLDRGLGWLLAQHGRESGAIERLRVWLSGERADVDTRYDGWCWFPGTAAWVAPTAFAVLALEKVAHRRPRQTRARLDEGREFLLSRRCRDGGWNQGSLRALGREAHHSYPENTGLVLVALRGLDPARLAPSLAAAERHLAACRSAEGVSWLELGLRAHGRQPATAAEPVCRNLIDCALRVMARAAAEGWTLVPRQAHVNG